MQLMGKKIQSQCRNAKNPRDKLYSLLGIVGSTTTNINT